LESRKRRKSAEAGKYQKQQNSIASDRLPLVTEGSLQPITVAVAHTGFKIPGVCSHSSIESRR
jgi:hypothetical protein